jgi:hypothetical protein
VSITDAVLNDLIVSLNERGIINVDSEGPLAAGRHIRVGVGEEIIAIFATRGITRSMTERFKVIERDMLAIKMVAQVNGVHRVAGFIVDRPNEDDERRAYNPPQPLVDLTIVAEHDDAKMGEMFDRLKGIS